MKILSFICLAGVLIMVLVIGGINTEDICMLDEVWVTNYVGFVGRSIYTSIAVDTNNNVHISWVKREEVRVSDAVQVRDMGIYYKKYDNRGNALTGDIIVTNDVDTPSTPHITIDTDNNVNVYILWTDYTRYKRGDENSEIYYKKYDNRGNALTGDIRVTNAPGVSRLPLIAVDTNNNVHILWVDERDGNEEVYYKKYDNRGNALTGDIRVTNTVGASYANSIAIDTNNNVHVSWCDYGDGGKNPEIYYKKYDNRGNALTGDIRVTNTADSSIASSIAVDANNNVHISWLEREVIPTSDTSSLIRNGRIYYKKYDNNGNALTEDIMVTNDAADYCGPLIAVDTNNNVHIVWLSERQREIYYKKYDNNGDALTRDIIVTNGTGRFSLSSIATDTNNNVYISWSRWVFEDRRFYYDAYYNKLYSCGPVDLFFKNIHLFLFVLLLCLVGLIISKTVKKKREEERKRWEEERRRKEEEARKREEEQRRQEEARRRWEEAKRREEEQRRWKEEARRREEEQRRREEEARRKKDYYKILGVSKNATLEEIKRRRNELVKQHHPDRFTDKKQKEEANEKMKEINEAYEILKDPERRRKYDKEMGF